MYYFLVEDFRRLNEQIEKINRKIAEIGKDMGESCREGAETFHDNFVYEDGERQQYMLSTHLRKLIGIRNSARIVAPGPELIVSIGKTVKFRDQSGTEHIHKIGSYLTFNSSDDDFIISYNSPLARLIVGAKKDEVRMGKVGHTSQSITITDIS